MAKTPGVILPSFYSSQAELEADLKRRNEEAGFTPWNTEYFVHSIMEHSGVKGMKWGVRRQQNKAARVQRLKSGKGTLKDKLIRDLDIGGTNTAVRGPKSTKKKVVMGVAGAALMAIGVMQVRSVLKQGGLMKASNLKHTRQLAELDQITNFMGSRMHGPLP